MGLSISPSRMLVAKVVSHRDLERELVLALEEFALFEPMDVRQQAGLSDIKRSREEESAFAVSDRISLIIDSLGLNTTHGTGVKVEVHDGTLADSLSYVADVVKAVESEVLELDKELAYLTTEHGRQSGIRDIALYIEPLGLDLGRIRTTEYTYTTVGKIETARLSKLEWSLNEITEGAFVFKALPVANAKDMSVASVSVSLDRKSSVERIFTAIGFETFNVPDDSTGSPETIAHDASERIIALERDISKLESRKASIAKEWGSKILAAWELLEIEKSRVLVKSYFVYTESSVKAWGWVPIGHEDELREKMQKNIGSAFQLMFDEPEFSEHESPTYLSNPSFMKPTEDVVGSYGYPSKHDIDPTKIMWLTFPMIFGVIFADVGQGFLILLIGLIAWRSNRKGQDWGQILGYVQNGALGLVMMGIFAMLGGFMFGSIFGAETVIEPLWPIFAHTLPSGEANPYRSAHMLKLSIEIGILQISLGIILDIYNKMKHREFMESLVSISYLWLYLGFVNLLLGLSYNSISSWFSAEGSMNLWLPIIGIGMGIGNNGVYPVLPISPLAFTVAMLFVPLILMALFSFKEGMDGAIHFIESAMGMISHTVSYARIFALNTVHIILSSVFLTMLPPLLIIIVPPLTVGGVVIIPEDIVTHDYVGAAYIPLLGAVIGTFIVGLLEGLLAFMHTLRLHFVEWFSKFYHAGGVAFAPFAIKRVFTTTAPEVAVVSSYAVN
jgi:V/A-type H+-transporting ATPase subunit I